MQSIKHKLVKRTKIEASKSKNKPNQNLKSKKKFTIHFNSFKLERALNTGVSIEKESFLKRSVFLCLGNYECV